MVSFLSKETLEVSIDVHIPLFGEDTTQILVYGPCNGIVCLYGPRLPLANDRELGDDDIALWNPATREFRVLPLSRPSISRPPDYDILWP